MWFKLLKFQFVTKYLNLLFSDMPVQKTSLASPTEVLEDFLTSFVPTDNFKVNETVMRQVVAEAMVSLLIRHQLDSDTFLQYFENVSLSKIEFKKAFPYTIRSSHRDPSWKPPANSKPDQLFIVPSRDGNVKCDVEGFASDVLAAKIRWKNNNSQNEKVFFSNTTFVVDGCEPWEEPANQNEISICRQGFCEEFQYYWGANLYRLFEFMIKDAKKRPPENLWRKMTREPFEFFAPIKKSILGTSPVDFAYGENCWWEQWAEQHNSNWQQCPPENQIHWLLKKIASGGLYPDAFPKACKDYLFEFKNSYGEVESGVYVEYDFREHTKTLVPVTAFPVEHSPRQFVATVPPPDKKLQLFNLEKICTDTPKNILITDSIQIAALNTEWLERRGWIITSFLCLDDNYDAVDWEPLSNEDNAIQGIYYLITNHSGLSLEKSYQNAYNFQHVQEEEGPRLRIHDLHYLQLAVQYPEYKSFASLKDFLDFSNENQLQCVEGSALLLDESKFLEIYQRAIAPRKPFWEAPDAPLPVQKSESASNEPIPYVLRPALRRGQITELYAPKSGGKSMLALCMSMAVIAAGQNTYQVFKELLWRASPNPEKKFETNKVLYLAFEQPDRVTERLTNMKKEVWKTRVAECDPNFILEDKMLGKNFLATENQPELLKRINQATDEGTPGQPVDLVVIDTLSSCVGSSSMTDIGQRITELRMEIQRRNIVLLILHHSNDEGGSRWGEEPLKSVDLTIRMANCPLDELGKGDKNKSHLEETKITEPIGIIRHKSNNDDDWVKSRFDGFFSKDDSNWHVDCKGEDTEIFEARMLTEVVAYYKGKGFTREAIAKMLGTSDNTLRKKLEEAKKLLKGRNK